MVHGEGPAIAPPSGRPRVLVFLEHGLSLESWRSAGDPSQLNGATPYGYGAAAGVVDMAWSTDAVEGALAHRIRRSLRHVLGFDIVHAWRHRRALRAAEVVWTHTEREALAALAVLALTGGASTRVIAQTVWLWDEWPRLSPLRRAIARHLLGRAAVEITLSPRNRDRSRIVRRTDNVYFVPFGAAVNREVLALVARESRPAGSPYVLAVGSDRHRDWATLHAAARMLPGVSFRVATLSPDYPRHDLPTNVVVEPSPSLRAGYEASLAARMVVLPLAPNLHASGCTVALETQHLGVPLVTADVGGLGGYLGDRGVHLYRQGDAASLADVIAEELRRQGRGHGIRPNAEGLAARGLTADDYVGRYVVLTRWLLEGRPAPDTVERTVPMRAMLRPPP
jgi:glycosyltransferase involved in cell wall biosynthesis